VHTRPTSKPRLRAFVTARIKPDRDLSNTPSSWPWSRPRDRCNSGTWSASLHHAVDRRGPDARRFERKPHRGPQRCADADAALGLRNQEDMHGGRLHVGHETEAGATAPEGNRAVGGSHKTTARWSLPRQQIGPGFRAPSARLGARAARTPLQRAAHRTIGLPVHGTDWSMSRDNVSSILRSILNGRSEYPMQRSHATTAHLKAWYLAANGAATA